jgi:membrane AbrB-like protein
MVTAKDTVTNALRLLAVGALGAAILWWLEVPAAWMVGPLLAVSAVRVARPGLHSAPPAFAEVGKVILGTMIGATFHRSTLEQLGHLLPWAVAATLALMAVALIASRLLARWTDLDLGTALFSLTPGGMPEMVAVAEEIGADLGVVAVLQFVRYTCVLALAPWLITRLGS